jgi:hypothetical protein
MENITIIEIEDMHGVLVKHVIIDKGNGETIGMEKSIYDAQLAALSTPIVTEDE